MSSIPEKALIYTRRLCQSEEQFSNVKRKGVFCYDYVTDTTKLEDTSPPSKEAFFSRLQNRPISDEDYKRFCDTWRVFGFANLGEYADFYLRLDVSQLCDVFQEFRKFCMNNYGLVCVNSLTLPIFSFDAFIKITRAEIELFTDIDMINLINSAIRGGISQCSLRHVVADIPLIPDKTGNVNPQHGKGPSTYIQYLDVTALYAFRMCKPLPYADYRWLSSEELMKLSSIENGQPMIMTIPDDGPYGFLRLGKLSGATVAWV